MERNITVLVAPLDWGLGHATRCIPVIRDLLSRKVKVIICAAGTGKIILANYFPDCTFIEIPGISVNYPSSGSMSLSMLRQFFKILKAIRKENGLLQAVIEKYKITHIISDNRYGLYSKKIKCSVICHQVKIQLPSGFKFLQPLIYNLHINRLQKFQQLWIPDNPYPDNLSGLLSHPITLKIPVMYTGILSRFKELLTVKNKVYDYLAILSGPEPQRTLLELKVLEFFKSSGKKCLMVGGAPGEYISHETDLVTTMSYITDEILNQILHMDTTLICRPGYSTLMDLTVLGHRKIIFIPTPGQTEQEYLGMELELKYNYTVISQYEKIPDTIHSGKPLSSHLLNPYLQETIRQFLE